MWKIEVLWNLFRTFRLLCNDQFKSEKLKPTTSGWIHKEDSIVAWIKCYLANQIAPFISATNRIAHFLRQILPQRVQNIYLKFASTSTVSNWRLGLTTHQSWGCLIKLSYQVKSARNFLPSVSWKLVTLVINLPLNINHAAFPSAGKGFFFTLCTLQKFLSNCFLRICCTWSHEPRIRRATLFHWPLPLLWRFDLRADSVFLAKLQNLWFLISLFPNGMAKLNGIVLSFRLVKSASLHWQ